MTKAIKDAKEWLYAQPSSSTTTITHESRWDLPMIGGRCISDGAWNPVTCVAGLGWILYGPTNAILSQGSKGAAQISSALMAEALARQKDLQKTTIQNFQIKSMMSDCKHLIDLINARGSNSHIYRIMQDIQRISQNLKNSSFNFIPKNWTL